jgi:hypothetical protein
MGASSQIRGQEEIKKKLNKINSQKCSLFATVFYIELHNDVSITSDFLLFFTQQLSDWLPLISQLTNRVLTDSDHSKKSTADWPTNQTKYRWRDQKLI